MENLKLAHQNARKGKGWYQEVRMVDEDPEKYLGQLQEMLLNKTYNTSEYVTFIKHDSGKDREINPAVNSEKGSERNPETVLNPPKKKNCTKVKMQQLSL